LPDIFIALLRF